MQSLPFNNPDGYRTYLNTLPQKTFVSKAEDADRFTPEAENTDFIGRENELRSLTAFCDETADFKWWAVTATGGSGKTRLLRKLTANQQERGWSVHWLGSTDYTESVLSSFQSTPQNLLIISDYAGEHVDVLAGWIERLSNHRGQKIRLLLAERESTRRTSPGEQSNDRGILANFWHDRMKEKIGPNSLNRAQFGDPGNFLLLGKMEDLELRDLMNSYAKRVFGRSLLENETDTLYRALENSDPGLCRPLYAMFLTDALIQNGASTQWDRQTILRELIEREERHVIKRLEGCLSRQSRAVFDSVKALQLFATIRNGASLNEAPTDAKDRLRSKIEEIDRCSLAECLMAAQITESQSSGQEIHLMPLKPDLLGEYYILKNMEKALPMLFCPGWALRSEIAAFVDRMIQDYSADLPEPFWARLFEAIPQDESEAYALMDRLFTVTYSAGKDVCGHAVARMTQVFETFPNRLIALYYAQGLFNLSNAQELTGREASIETLRVLSQERFPEDREIALVYAQGLVNLSAAQELTGREASIETLRVLSQERFPEDREIALEYAKGLNNLAVAFFELRDLPNAIRNSDQALALFRQKSGNGHPNTEAVQGLNDFLKMFSTLRDQLGDSVWELMRQQGDPKA